jgi:DNA-directed RNA polymerase specialized sigma24 family protein
MRLSRNEPEQFAALFRRRAPEIRRYVTRRLGADAAEDVVAETFLVAFRQRSGYDFTRATRGLGSMESPRTWSAVTEGPRRGCCARWPVPAATRSPSRSPTG